MPSRRIWEGAPRGRGPVRAYSAARATRICGRHFPSLTTSSALGSLSNWRSNVAPPPMPTQAPQKSGSRPGCSFRGVPERSCSPKRGIPCRRTPAPGPFASRRSMRRSIARPRVALSMTCGKTTAFRHAMWQRLFNALLRTLSFSRSSITTSW